MSTHCTQDHGGLTNFQPMSFLSASIAHVISGRARRSIVRGFPAEITVFVVVVVVVVAVVVVVVVRTRLESL